MTPTAGEHPATDLITTDPRDGTVIASRPIADRAAVADAVATAKDAAAWWAAQGYAGRKRVLLAWKGAIARSAKDLAGVIAAETGKPDGDALLEVMLTLGHLDWAAKHAEPVLKRRRVKSGLANYNRARRSGTSRSASSASSARGTTRSTRPWARSRTPSRPATRSCSSRASSPPAPPSGSPRSGARSATARCSRS